MQVMREDDPITSINITPLVDVSLVLVIIFMITMPFLIEKALRVQSSSQKVVPASSVSEPVLVEVKGDAIRVEETHVSLPELSSVVQKLLKERGVEAVAVSANQSMSHGQVVQVLDELTRAGIKELNLLDPQESLHENK